MKLIHKLKLDVVVEIFIIIFVRQAERKLRVTEAELGRAEERADCLEKSVENM